MTLTPDEVAGVVDLFGVVTRDELDRALEELAYRREAEISPAVVESALDAYTLIAYEADENERFAVGPAAFPTLPDEAADLPHILDIDARAPDRETVTTAAERRFRADVARAVDAGDTARIERLLDVSYDLDAWGDLSLEELRARLDDALADR